MRTASGVHIDLKGKDKMRHAGSFIRAYLSRRITWLFHWEFSQVTDSCKHLPCLPSSLKFSQGKSYFMYWGDHSIKNWQYICGLGLSHYIQHQATLPNWRLSYKLLEGRKQIQKINYRQVDAFEVRWFVPRMITITVTSSWYFLLLPAGILINSSILKPAVKIIPFF